MVSVRVIQGGVQLQQQTEDRAAITIMDQTREEAVSLQEVLLTHEPIITAITVITETAVSMAIMEILTGMQTILIITGITIIAELTVITGISETTITAVKVVI